MKLFSKIAVRVIPVGVLAFIIVAAIAYQRGVYDITFIERPTDSVTESESSSGSTAADTSTAESTKPTETSTTAPADTSAPEMTSAEKIKEFRSRLDSTDSAIAEGYSVTDGVYTSDMKLTRMNPAVPIDSRYSLRTMTKLLPERIPAEEYSSYTTQYNSVTVNRPLVDVYMDYVVIDDGLLATVLDRAGNLLYSGFDINYCVPAYTRDKNDIPQFRVLVEPTTKYGKVTTHYYNFDADGNFVESKYNDAADNRGFYYNYPSYFGKSENAYKTNYNNGSFAFVNANGSSVSGYRYASAFNYSDELAAVTTLDEIINEEVLTYVNNRFTVKISAKQLDTSWGWHYNLTGRRVATVYRLPDSRGIESAGFIYFDHGLTRLRVQDYDYYHTYDSNANNYPGHHYILCCGDTEYVIRTDGTKFPIPGDYTVQGYSNGVFLLERNGLYGYMDYTGKWIAQPIYDYAETFSEGLGVLSKNGKTGMIDTSGNFVLPMEFDSVQSASGGIIAAYDLTNGWSIFNKVTING